MNRAQANICIIFNPTAKGERAKKWAGEIKRCFPGAEFHVTRDGGHARELARAAALRGCGKVVAVGGDGTINEVVNGIAGTAAALGIVPLGTANVFALELGIPAALEAAAAIVRAGRLRTVDLARAGRRHFIQLAGVGFDAETVQAADLAIKRRLGPLSYVLAAARVAAQEPPVLTVEADDRRREEGCFMLVGNGRYYGGPFEFFPGARLDDGWLEVCLFKRRSHMDLLHYFQGVLCGTHTHFEDVEYFRARRIRVSAAHAVPVEVDGELAGVTPVEFAVGEQPLQVCVAA
ncbi:MAG: diacylglycerol kinase family lipid kinase [Verrucomicrobiales bacterium]|jgi:YegS/Rv2252/BmrU family lipid kinase|nr:diacylglycerol kinase family lipid kinase [Verrucomicrobiales bacterium]